MDSFKDDLVKIIAVQGSSLLAGISNSSVNTFKKVLSDLETKLVDEKIDPNQISNAFFQLKASKYGQKVLAANPDLRNACASFESMVRASIVDGIYEINAHLFSKVSWDELKNTKGYSNVNLCPNIVNVANGANQLSNFIANSIVAAKNIDERTLRLQHCIHVTEGLLKKGDFGGFTAAMAGINSIAVGRLDATKAGLSDDDKALFNEMVVIVSRRNNSKALRDKQTEAIDEQKKIIPAMNLMQTDATFIWDANENKEKANSLLEERVGSFFSIAQEKIKAPEKFPENQSYIKIDGSIKQADLDKMEDDGIEKSQILEPKDVKIQPSKIIESLKTENAIAVFVRKAFEWVMKKLESTPVKNVDIKENKPTIEVSAVELSKTPMETPTNKRDHLSTKAEHTKLVLMSPKPIKEIMKQRKENKPTIEVSAVELSKETLMEMPTNKRDHLSTKVEHTKLVLMSPKPIKEIMKQRKENPEKNLQYGHFQSIDSNEKNDLAGTQAENLSKKKEDKQPVPPSNLSRMALNSTYKQPKEIPEEKPIIDIDRKLQN